MNGRCNISDESTWHFCLAELQNETTLLMIPTLVYLCLLSVTGIMGNSLVLVVYPMRFTRSPIRTFIMAVAGFDLLTNTIVIPAEMYDIFHSWDFDQSGLCKARLFFNATTTIASALLLLAIAVTRYRKICRPFGWQVTMHHTKVINAAVLFLALLFSVPCAITNGIQRRKTKYPNIYGYSCLVDDHFSQTPWPTVNSVFFVVLFLLACVPLVVLYVLIGTTARRHTTTGRVGQIDIQPGNINNNTAVSNIATSKTADEASTSGPSLFTEHDKTAEMSRDPSSEDVRAQDHGDGKKHERISLRKRILLKFQGKQNLGDSIGRGVLKNTAYDYNDLAVCCRHSIERESVTSFSGYYQDGRDSAVQGIPKNGTELFIHGSHTLSLIKNKITDELSRSNRCDSQSRPRDVTGMSSEWPCGESEIDGETVIESDTKTDNFRTPVVIFLKEPTKQATVQNAAQTTTFCTAARETRSIPDAVLFSAKTMKVQSIHTACSDPAHVPGTSSGDKSKTLVPNVVSKVVSSSPLPLECNAARHQLQRSRWPKRIGRTSCMLLTMSVVFIGGFLPFLALQFFRSSAPSEVFQNMDKASLALYHLFLRSYLVNSAVNPVIYNLCHVKFRRECVKLFTRA